MIKCKTILKYWIHRCSDEHITDKTLNSQENTDELSFMRNLEKMECVIIIPHCIPPVIDITLTLHERRGISGHWKLNCLFNSLCWTFFKGKVKAPHHWPFVRMTGGLPWQWARMRKVLPCHTFSMVCCSLGCHSPKEYKYNMTDMINIAYGKPQQQSYYFSIQHMANHKNIEELYVAKLYISTIIHHMFTVNCAEPLFAKG